MPKIIVPNGGNCSTSKPISKTDATVARVPVPLISAVGSRAQKARIRPATGESPPAQIAFNASDAFSGDFLIQSRNFA